MYIYIMLNQSAEEVRKELEQKAEAQNKLKKEIKKLKKWIAEYQMMMRAGASGIHKVRRIVRYFYPPLLPSLSPLSIPLSLYACLLSSLPPSHLSFLSSSLPPSFPTSDIPHFIDSPYTTTTSCFFPASLPSFHFH